MLASEGDKLDKAPHELTILVEAAEPSKLSSTSLTASDSLVASASPRKDEISVSITVQGDNSNDSQKGFEVSREELAHLASLVQSTTSIEGQNSQRRASIRQLTSEEPAKSSATSPDCDISVSKCSLLHCLQACFGVRV